MPRLPTLTDFTFSHSEYSAKGFLTDGTDKTFTIDIQVESEDEATLKKSLHTLSEVMSKLPDYEQKIASELLELHNEEWKEEDADEIDEDEFTERIFLESIVINRDGSLVIYYNDGGLFCEHVIEVLVGAALEFESADIAG